MATLTALTFQHFRNHAQYHLDFDPALTIIVAPNASGKTAILEGVGLISSGSSFRADKIADAIEFGHEYARVKAALTSDDGQSETLELLLTRGVVQGKRTQSRLYSVNQVRRRRKDFIGHLPAVIFRPEDMRLMEGSPGRRRHFLDSLLSVTSAEYDRAVTHYEQVLLRRNRLLAQVKEGEMPRSTLQYWTQQLISSGTLLQDRRAQFLAFCHQVPFVVPFTVQYQPSLISVERMAEYAEREIAAGHTLIGPHKDDFMVMLQFAHQAAVEVQPLADFGSRGQQRLGVLWLKMCELAFLTEKMQQKPVLGLDDLMSELDSDVRQLVLELLSRYQTIVTTTDQHVADELSVMYPEHQLIHLTPTTTWYTQR